MIGSKAELSDVIIYFDKSVLRGVNIQKWRDFWSLARSKHIKGYYSPLTYIEITSRLHRDFNECRACLERIADANLGILHYPELVIATHLFGSYGLPEELLQEENANHLVFKATPDFVLKYCTNRTALDQEHIVDILNCPPNLRKLIQNRNREKSKLIIVSQYDKHRFFRVNFKFTLLGDFRKRYEEQWLADTVYMREATKRFFKKEAKRLGISKYSVPLVINKFTRTHLFKVFFLEALFDRVGASIYQCKTSLPIMPKKWGRREVADKLDSLNAFFFAYRNLMIKEFAGRIAKNDYVDLHLLVYLCKNFWLVTDDRKFLQNVKYSHQKKRIITFRKALKLLKS